MSVSRKPQNEPVPKTYVGCYVMIATLIAGLVQSRKGREVAIYGLTFELVQC